MSAKRRHNSPKHQKKIYQSQYRATTWVFTLNNYDDDDLTRLQELTFPSSTRSISTIGFQEEIAPTTGTPHLQGFLQCFKKGKNVEKK